VKEASIGLRAEKTASGKRRRGDSLRNFYNDECSPGAGK
jgi:hypothetical protein